MWLIPLTPSMSTGKKRDHFAPLLPSSIILINLICVISSHLLTKRYQIPIGKNSDFFLHHFVKSFCFQFLKVQSWTLLLVFILLFHELPSAYVSRMLSGLAGVSLMVVLLQPPKTIYFLPPTIASSALTHYKQKHLQCAVENPTELAKEWPKWPNVSSVLLPAEFRCWQLFDLLKSNLTIPSPFLVYLCLSYWFLLSKIWYTFVKSEIHLTHSFFSCWQFWWCWLSSNLCFN